MTLSLSAIFQALIFWGQSTVPCYGEVRTLSHKTLKPQTLTPRALSDRFAKCNSQTTSNLQRTNWPEMKRYIRDPSGREVMPCGQSKVAQLKGRNQKYRKFHGDFA
jgi:hypothetical protein